MEYSRKNIFYAILSEIGQNNCLAMPALESRTCSTTTTSSGACPEQNLGNQEGKVVDNTKWEINLLTHSIYKHTHEV